MTSDRDLIALRAGVCRVEAVKPVGRVTSLTEAMVQVSGLGEAASLGDGVRILCRDGQKTAGEIMSLAKHGADILPSGRLEGVSRGDKVVLDGPVSIFPSSRWIGRIIDPVGRPLDGRPLAGGAAARSLVAPAPPATSRRPLGQRLETGIASFNTLLPIVTGQRLGLFAGSGVGKSSLLASLTRNIEADVTVVALIGERGREVRQFAHDIVGPEAMKRTVIIAATSDQPPVMRRRCAWAAMAVAEHFRDAGKNVLLLADSITRFAEAHREIALSMGEPATFQGYPPSVPHQIMALSERAGPGAGIQGDITAIFTVLVAGSDMDGPIADTLRGVLDGHIVLDRSIAERGRFPAIDLLRSASRSLPEAATDEENQCILEARQLLGTYERAELMIQSGLYTAGSDPEIDRAIACWPGLDSFLARTHRETISDSFAALRKILGKA